MDNNDIKILGWLSLVWLTFCLGVFVLVLSGMKISDDGLALLKDGIPNWLQGLGTVAAAFFAFRALKSWREQEDYRRKSALAEKVLMDADAFVSAARRAVDLHLYQEPLEVGEAREKVEERKRAIKAAQDVGRLLAVQLKPIAAVLGSDVEGAVRDLFLVTGMQSIHLLKADRLLKRVEEGGSDVMEIGQRMLDLRELFQAAGVFSIDAFTKRDDVRTEADIKLQMRHEALEAMLGDVFKGKR